MRNTIFKRLLACALSLVLASSVAACGSTKKEENKNSEAVNVTNGESVTSESSEAVKETEKEAEPQTLRVLWWGNQNRADSTSAMLKRFEETHPGVTVEVEFTDWAGYWDKLSTLAISNNMPDVIQMDMSKLVQYSESNLLNELDSYIASGAIDLSDANQSILNSGKYNDVTYAIPTGSNTMALAYRVDVAKEAGVEIPMEPTWSELIDICKTVYEKTGRTEILTEGFFEYSLRNAGLAFFNEDQTTLGFDDTSYLVNYWNRHLTAVEEGYGLDIGKKTAAGAGASLVQDTWLINVWTNQLAAYETDGGCEVALVQIPQEDNAVAPSNWLKPAVFWSVPAGAENKELAAEFLNWYVNEKEVYDITGIDRGVPIDAEVNAYISDKLDATSAKSAEFVSWISTEGEVGELPVDVNPKAGEVRSLLIEVTDSVNLGAVTDLEAAANDFMERANALLAEGAE